MKRFTKIGADGQPLPDDATEWVAVQDNQTGLMWSVAETKSMPWKKAAAAAEGLQLCGLSGWRLPTVEELFLLADRTKFNPAIDTTFFPDCKSDWYWSASPCADSPGDCAWLVYFNDGDSIWGGQNYGGFVRAVRASQ